MLDGEGLALVLGLGLTAIVFTAFIVVFVKIAQKERQQKAQKANEARYSEKNSVQVATQKSQQRQVANTQRVRSDNSRKQSLADLDKHEMHQADAKKHAHMGEEEHYEEIVGSLGEVNDEGCADLIGVRFIAHDLAYEMSENEHPNYDKIAQAMVMGEILNSPRFKNPYIRK